MSDKNDLIIHIEPLKKGVVRHLDETVSADFMDMKEGDISFVNTVRVKGDVYLAEDELVLHVEMFATALMPCTICNKQTEVSVHVPLDYQAFPAGKIHHNVFDFKSLVRENVILACPEFIECNNGNCPERQVLEKYFKESSDEDALDAKDNYRPFADLDFEQFKDKPFS